MQKPSPPQGPGSATNVDCEVVGEFEDEMLCPICHDPLADPVIHQKCRNMFCRSCIDEWRKSSQTCPVCRDSLIESDISQVVPRVLTNKLQSLRVKHTPCGTELPRSGLAAHRDVCPMALISCTAAEYGCEWRAARNALAQHLFSCPPHLLRHEFARLRRALEEQLEGPFQFSPAAAHGCAYVVATDAAAGPSGDRRLLLHRAHEGLNTHRSRCISLRNAGDVPVPYSTGTHCFTTQVLKSASNYIMLGITPIANWDCYPGHASISAGKSLYGANGFVYQAATHGAYGSSMAFGAGSLVSMILDLTGAPTVQWVVNGRAGPKITLTANTPYYAVLNLYTAGDACELVPSRCWSKNAA